ncbi:MAG: hypothetical protein WDN27_06195 [Candidatus Saccharibacteria bacterium]
MARVLPPARRPLAFSANFELYGDISERITNLLASITPRIEVYSVDESFLDLTELGITDYQRWGLSGPRQYPEERRRARQCRHQQQQDAGQGRQRPRQENPRAGRLAGF